MALNLSTDWTLTRNVVTSIGGVIAISGAAYTADDVRDYTQNYIQPGCQRVDPSGEEAFRGIVPTREPLFAAMDRIVRGPGPQRFLIILAQQGSANSDLPPHCENKQSHDWTIHAD